ncbi:hypothetical protein Fcan01_18865 [Folsomia candida]|uniref:Core-binding (CB) domain-containing protein n=1 Tax=Folsomia candida TaxID=158441 RepID=A0A226DQ69_FOLCA|nr:hypothetical protein Fcan01_18865 [Folsomia candida]
MIKNGSPIEAVDVIISSLSKSTIKIYNSSLKSWWEFCAASNLDPYFPSVESVLKHLTARYHAGVGYSSINTSRSAISLLSPRLDRPLGQDPLVSRFVKGIGKIKPPAPKYNSNIYTLYFWVDVGDNAPTKAPKNGAKSRRRRSPEDEEWDKKCWGMQYLQPEVWEGWLPNLHERWCHQPHPVICIDDNVLA